MQHTTNDERRGLPPKGSDDGHRRMERRREFARPRHLNTEGDTPGGGGGAAADSDMPRRDEKGAREALERTERGAREDRKWKSVPRGGIPSSCS